MLRLTRGQRALVGDKLADVANIGAGALIFGQFVGDLAFSPWLIAAGLLMWLALMVLAIVSTGRDGQ